MRCNAQHSKSARCDGDGGGGGRWNGAKDGRLFMRGRIGRADGHHQNREAAAAGVGMATPGQPPKILQLLDYIHQ